MMNKKCTLVIGFTGVLLGSLNAQQLTPEQIKAASDKEAQTALVELEGEAAFDSLPPAELNRIKFLEDAARADMNAIMEELDESAAHTALEKTLKKNSSGTPALTPTSTASTVTLTASGGGGMPMGLFENGECAPNKYIFWNLPPFTDSRWQTITDPTKDYPWSLSNSSMYGTNGQGIQSYLPANYPGVITRSCAYYVLTNDFDQYGDPKAHQLSFWYKFSTDGLSIFRCSLAWEPGDQGYFYTNLPPTSTWRRVTCSIPPIHNSYTGEFPRLMFTAIKNTTAARTGPFAVLDPSVQWCAIDTPYPSPSDLGIQKVAGGSVQVYWNTYTYPVDRWNLQFAYDPSGPYSTVTDTPTYANGFAYVTFAAADKRFYRMAHHQ